MGLDAQVIGIGAFGQKIVPCMEYPKEFYAGIPEGAAVITNVVCAVTSQQSHYLAQCFGVKAMELGRHVLNAEAADMVALEKEFGSETVEKFRVLQQAGFKFYYLPNA